MLPHSAAEFRKDHFEQHSTGSSVIGIFRRKKSDRRIHMLSLYFPLLSMVYNVLVYMAPHRRPIHIRNPVHNSNLREINFSFLGCRV